jgi:hypothetical protein
VKAAFFSRMRTLETLQQAVLDEFDCRFVSEMFAPAMVVPKGLLRLNSQVGVSPRVI